MSISLFEHNEKAYLSAVSMLKERGKTAVIHPTGTGKSFIGFKLCEDNPDKTVCWLSPSSYIFRTQIENLEKTGADIPQNIKFFTYAKLSQMTDEEIAEINTDILIYDEYHRAGAEHWQTGVERLSRAYPETPVMGLSATNVRYLDNQRDMADELFDGNIASEMTLGEAIVRGILKAPLYISTVFSYRKELERYTKRLNQPRNISIKKKAEKYLEELRRAIEKSDGLETVFEKYMPNKYGKYVAFCSNKEHLDEMILNAHHWFEKIDRNPKIYKVYSDNAEASTEFADFKSDKSECLRVLFCIDMLNEGVHLDDIDGVILFRPTVSPTVYKQQIGRALTAGKSGTPVIFDVINNFENLYSMGSIEQEMANAISYYNSLGEGDKIIVDKFEIIGVVKDCVELFDKLNEAFTATWEEMYSYAEKYYQEHSNLEVPRRYKTENGLSLGNWIDTQRGVRAGKTNGILTEEKIALLDKIGMRWESAADINFEKNYAEAVKYSEEYGSFVPPATYIADSGVRLGAWAANLRTWRKSGVHSAYLNEKRIELLDKIGMVWNVPDYIFERNFAEALAFYKANGHLDIPADFVSNGVKLGSWIRNLRTSYNNPNKSRRRLEAEQISRLESIGMKWFDVFTRAWENGFEHAGSYFERYNNLNVSPSYVCADGFKLGDWINNQRESLYRMKPERKEKLDSIGMIWKKPDSWEMRFALLKDYYDEHHDLDIPPQYIVNGIWLNKWLNEQQQIYNGNRKGKTLTEEQIKRLESIGFSPYNKHKRLWLKNFEMLKEFYENNKNSSVTYQYEVNGVKLGHWCTVQRSNYRKGKLDDEQIKLLNSVEFAFELKDNWDEMFFELKEYKKTFGNVNVPKSFICKNGINLCTWIGNQKTAFKKGKLSEERQDKLSKLGVVFENSADIAWNNNYEIAKEFYKAYGHIDVIVNMNNEKALNSLGYWLYAQRKNKSQLSDEQIRKLNDIGMIWTSPVERKWENGLNHLIDYKNRYGNVTPMVTYKSDDSFLLGRWVRVQQQKFADGKLTKTQIERLCEIGVELSGDTA